MSRGKNQPIVLTIGHSTRPLGDFIALLKSHGVERIADVRTVPRSRHNPQFNRETLPAALRRAKISYVHLAKLGGPQRPEIEFDTVTFRAQLARALAGDADAPQLEFRGDEGERTDG